MQVVSYQNPFRINENHQNKSVSRICQGVATPSFAPLVINHANAIVLAEKAFLQVNREHKKERDERNLKLQINMRLMITRSSSLYSKGLITTGEQDQELGPWFTASGLGGTAAAKRCLFHKEIKN